MKAHFHIFIVLFLLVCVSYFSISAQSDGNNSTQLTYLITGNSFAGAERIWLFNPLNGQKGLLFDLQEDKLSHFDIQFDWENGDIYVLEVENDTSEFPPLGASNIVRIDGDTFEQDVLFSFQNVTEFMLSPDNRHALLRYYPEGIEAVERSNVALGQWCIVLLADENADCTDNTIPQEVMLSHVIWADSETIAYRPTSDATFNLYDVATENIITIEVPDNSVVSALLPIPSKNEMLVHLTSMQTSGSCELYSLDLDSSNHNLSIITQLDCSSTHQFWDVSPDGNSLILGYSGIPALLIDVQSGEVIRQIETSYGMEWNSIQWLNEPNDNLAIGQLFYRGEPVMMRTFSPSGQHTVFVHSLTTEFRKIIVPN